jgi:hypothetical protein
VTRTNDEDQDAVFADALPDQPGPADLGHRGQGEQQDRAQHGHSLTLPRRGGVAGQRGDHTKRAVGYDEQNLTGTGQ